MSCTGIQLFSVQFIHLIQAAVVLRVPCIWRQDEDGLNSCVWGWLLTVETC